MEYNTSQKKLILPEYGRNMHKFVDYACQIEDRETRNRVAQAIINIMGNMNPHLRDVLDFKHKLWDHLAIMSDFKLDIDAPYPLPTIETLRSRPKKVPYSKQKPRFMYYGKIVEELVDRISEMEESPEKHTLTVQLANHMKKSYIAWNKDSVSDEIIFNDIVLISKGSINPSRDIRLSDAKDLALPQTKQKKQKPRRQR